MQEQAVALHAADPKNYPDANHKPEMAIAISHFELLCGFRIPSEIVEHLRGIYPHLGLEILTYVFGGNVFSRLVLTMNNVQWV